jgi:hypothetical protein
MINQNERWDVPAFKAGQTVILDITCYDNDGEKQNLTNGWVGCTFRSEYGGAEIFSVDSDEGDVVLDELNGNIRINVSAENSRLLNTTGKQTRGVFDVKVVLGSDVDYPVSDGRWYCNPSSTVHDPAEEEAAP